jgi:hypothetical protein
MSLAAQSAIDAAKPLHNALPAIDTEAPFGAGWSVLLAVVRSRRSVLDPERRTPTRSRWWRRHRRAVDDEVGEDERAHEERDE